MADIMNLCQNYCNHDECRDLYLSLESKYIQKNRSMSIMNSFKDSSSFVCYKCHNKQKITRNDEKFVFEHSKAYFGPKNLYISIPLTVGSRKVNSVSIRSFHAKNVNANKKYCEILKCVNSSQMDDKAALIADFASYMSHCVNNETYEIQARHVAWTLLSMNFRNKKIDIREACGVIMSGRKDVGSWSPCETQNKPPGNFIDLLMENKPQNAVNSAVLMNRWDLAMSLGHIMGLESITTQYCDQIRYENEFVGLFMSYLTNTAIPSVGASDWCIHLAVLLTVLHYDRDIATTSIKSIFNMLVEHNLYYGSIVCLLVLHFCADVPLSLLISDFTSLIRSPLSSEILVLLQLLECVNMGERLYILGIQAQFVSHLTDCALYEEAVSFVESIFEAVIQNKTLVLTHVVFQLYEIYCALLNNRSLQTPIFTKIHHFMTNAFATFKTDTNYDHETTETISNGDLPNPDPAYFPTCPSIPEISPPTVPKPSPCDVPIENFMSSETSPNIEIDSQFPKIVDSNLIIPSKSEKGEQNGGSTLLKSAMSFISGAFKRSTKESMYWNEDLKRWIDPNDPDKGDECIPLPQSFSSADQPGSICRPVMRRDDSKLHFDVLVDRGNNI